LSGVWQTGLKNETRPPTSVTVSPSEIISHTVWLYHRFCLSFREVEELFAECGVMVTYETVCQWCQKFGAGYARKLKKRQGRLVHAWNINEVFVIMQGPRHDLYRAVGQDGNVVAILLHRRRYRQNGFSGAGLKRKAVNRGGW